MDSDKLCPSSSEDKSDDEDSNNALEGMASASSPVDSSTDRKKQVHLRCEQMRREAIKTGYTELKDLLPAEFSPLGFKTTNASILYRAADYLKKLQSQCDAQNEEMDRLQSQLVALQIICGNYEQLAVQNDVAQGSSADQGIAAIKFNLLRKVIDSWFSSFESHVSCDDYKSLTMSLLKWFEQEVDMQAVPDLLIGVLMDGGNV